QSASATWSNKAALLAFLSVGFSTRSIRIQGACPPDNTLQSPRSRHHRGPAGAQRELGQGDPGTEASTNASRWAPARGGRCAGAITADRPSLRTIEDGWRQFGRQSTVRFLSVGTYRRRLTKKWTFGPIFKPLC